MQRFGRYEVIGRIGVGGMAEIFLAQIVGPEGFQRPVVIKRILPHLAEEEHFRGMFLDEAKTIARIRHHNVVQVFELGEEQGELYLVMEYLEGESVASIMRRSVARRRRIPFGVAVHLVAEMCSGLEAAHANAVIHRDVSVSNVFVTYDGGVKLIDFGIALGEQRDTKTEPGRVKGKFAYMSPEQAVGRALDARSDIFSVAVVLYEATTGRRLFRRKQDAATLSALLHEPIPPPSMFVSSYPKRLEKICLKGLARDRKERYQSAAELRAALLECARDLFDEPDPAGKLGAMMRSLFADRLEEKSRMLCRLEVGELVSEVPRGSVESAPAIPTVVETASGVSAPEYSFAEPEPKALTNTALPASGRVPRLLIIPLFILGVAFGIWLMNRGGTKAQTSPVAVRPLPASTISIAISSRPLGSAVWLEGNLVGTTPLTVSVPNSATPLQLRVSKEGHDPYVRRIVPREETTVFAELRPTPQPTIDASIAEAPQHPPRPKMRKRKRQKLKKSAGTIVPAQPAPVKDAGSVPKPNQPKRKYQRLESWR